MLIFFLDLEVRPVPFLLLRLVKLKRELRSAKAEARLDTSAKLQPVRNLVKDVPVDWRAENGEVDGLTGWQLWRPESNDDQRPD